MFCRRPLYRLYCGPICFDLQGNGFSNNEYRLLYGVVGTATSLVAAGFGVVWTSNTTLKLQIHNGTTLQESASLTIPTVSINAFNRYMIVWDGPILTLYNKTMSISGVTSRWSRIGSLTGSLLPNNASGTKIVAAHVATGTPAFSTGLRIRSFNIAPFVAVI